MFGSHASMDIELRDKHKENVKFKSNKSYVIKPSQL